MNRPVQPVRAPTPAANTSSALPKRSLTTKWAGRAVKAWRVIVAVVLGYRGEELALRAGNLTFITITSLVPLAAVVLSLLEVFSSVQGEHHVEKLVTRFFQDILSPGGEATIHKFLTGAKSRAGGNLSFVALLVSAGILVRHLDASLNQVWSVRRRRPILLSIGLYLGVLLVGPLLMAVTLLGTDTVKQLIVWLHIPFSGVAFELGSLLTAVSVLTLLYKLAPHAHVPWRSALFGGAVAGLAWELARHLYRSIADLFWSANPLYGSLGIAPLFLTWAYVAWYIVLSGARLAYAVEHADFHDEFRDLLAHPRSAELIATRMAALVAHAALKGLPAPTVLSLATSLKLPAQRIADLAFHLEGAGLLLRRKDELFPAREPSALTVADISAAVGGTVMNAAAERKLHTGLFERVASIYSAVDDASVEKLKEISWADLANEELEPQKP